MPQQPKQTRESRDTGPGKRSYGYGYGGSYGYGGYPAVSKTGIGPQTIQDYLLILRERIWYVVVGFLVVFSAALIYTQVKTPVYQSTASVEIFRRNPTVLQGQQIEDVDERSEEDINTQINILKSETVIQRVISNLSPEDLKRLVSEYSTGSGEAPDLVHILDIKHDIEPQRLSLLISVSYEDTDKVLAAKIANLFANQYIAYSAQVQVEDSLRAVEELEHHADLQRIKVDDLAKALQAYREKNNLVSLDQRRDITLEKLKELNMQITQDSAALQDAETRWKQVQSARTHGDDLLTLPFIASVPAVSQLQQQVASSKIVVAQLSERYRAKHPMMIQAVNSLNEAERQLRQAIDTTTAQVEVSYQTTLQNYHQAQASLATEEDDSLKLDRYAVDYANLQRDFDVNEKLLEEVIGRMRETSMTGNVEAQIARLVDQAKPERRPISPNLILDLAIGLAGGVFFGVFVAFLVNQFDDRIKSAYDIEEVVGLPLLSIIPKFKKIASVDDSFDGKFIPPTQREVVEAFSTLYSSLRLKEESKSAKCIVITSTIPGEGKSLIARNLALTFAAHGEKVLLIDCDLRRPVVHRAFHVENQKGVIEVCSHGTPAEELIVKNVQPNLDVLPSGGRSKNPARDLTSGNFEKMLIRLREQYDRIFIDTPPTALVSDAMLILPIADGSIYAIFFNKVKRKAAQFCVQRLLEIKKPAFGAVLNGLDMGIGGYYYQQYYDKSYKKYYVTEADDKG